MTSSSAEIDDIVKLFEALRDCPVQVAQALPHVSLSPQFRQKRAWRWLSQFLMQDRHLACSAKELARLPTASLDRCARNLIELFPFDNLGWLGLGIATMRAGNWKCDILSKNVSVLECFAYAIAFSDNNGVCAFAHKWLIDCFKYLPEDNGQVVLDGVLVITRDDCAKTLSGLHSICSPWMPSGSWRRTARNISLTDGAITANLQRGDGSWVHASTTYYPWDIFDNIDGRFVRVNEPMPKTFL